MIGSSSHTAHDQRWTDEVKRAVVDHAGALLSAAVFKNEATSAGGDAPSGACAFDLSSGIMGSRSAGNSSVGSEGLPRWETGTCRWEAGPRKSSGPKKPEREL